MKGLALMLGPPKGEAEEEESSASTEESLAGEAFDAFQDGDKEGFTKAFVAAVRACANKSKGSGYEDEDESDEE